MPNRGNHYELAFESFLNHTAVHWHPINQTRKPAAATGRLKNFDYIIYPPHGNPQLVDVKGRRLSARLFKKGKLGQSWVTRDDLDSMTIWQSTFPKPAAALFVFAYWIFDLPQPDTFPPPQPAPSPVLYYHRHRFYSFVTAPLDQYRRFMKTRSPRWQTVFVPAAGFEAITSPFVPARL